MPHPVLVYPEPDGGFTVVFPDLPGCATVADTWEDVWPLAMEAKRLWIESVLEAGMDVPLPGTSTLERRQEQ
jgi:predicted RNase H-like HicB family nuclease